MRNKIRKALREGGPFLLIQRSVNFVYRNILEDYDFRRARRLNGVQIYSDKFLEPIIPERKTGDDPDYEKELVESLEENILSDDDVTIIGGGFGVTAFRAEEHTDGEVVVYEASEEQVDIIKRSKRLNNSEVQVFHAIVGEEKDVWGKPGEAKRIDPKEIENCDILELDCEGSELDILRKIEFSPRVIVVETHGHLGASTDDVRSLLKGKGYSIESEKNVGDDAKSGSLDVKILVAERND